MRRSWLALSESSDQLVECRIVELLPELDLGLLVGIDAGLGAGELGATGVFGRT